jgi:serine/threonine protein kinase
LFEILTGRPLFGESGNFNLIIREHLEGLPLKSSWPMEIPTAAQRLMKKALSRSSTERFENLAQLMDQLKGIEIRPEKDSGDDMESLTPEEKIVKGKSSDADTPSTGIPSQEITKVHQTQATKASWRSRLRSMLSADTQKFFLKVISPVNRTFHLEMDHVIIGRDSQCGIILEGMGISRQHAALERSKDGYLIKDLGSKNGTFVNGERLKGIRRLHPGDVVDLGNAARLIYNRE